MALIFLGRGHEVDAKFRKFVAHYRLSSLDDNRTAWSGSHSPHDEHTIHFVKGGEVRNSVA
jgi:hypothetical protein